jgi:hypothetical protein
MKQWYSASELAGLAGLPSLSKMLHEKPKLNNGDLVHVLIEVVAKNMLMIAFPNKRSNH